MINIIKFKIFLGDKRKMSNPNTCPSMNSFYDVIKKDGVLINNRYKLTLLFDDSAPIKQAFLQAQGDIGYDITSTNFSNITIWADGAKLPSRTQNVAEFKYQGFPIQYPTNFTFEQDFELNMRSDEKLKYRNAFLAWQNAISASDFNGDLGWGVAGGGHKNPALANCKAYVEIFNQSMQEALETYTLHGVFPTTVGTLELTNDEPVIATYNLQLKCQYWTVGSGAMDANR